MYRSTIPHACVVGLYARGRVTTTGRRCPPSSPDEINNDSITFLLYSTDADNYSNYEKCTPPPFQFDPRDFNIICTHFVG